MRDVRDGKGIPYLTTDGDVDLCDDCIRRAHHTAGDALTGLPWNLQNERAGILYASVRVLYGMEYWGE